jgi:hypothetical protein
LIFINNQMPPKKAAKKAAEKSKYLTFKSSVIEAVAENAAATKAAKAEPLNVEVAATELIKVQEPVQVS